MSVAQPLAELAERLPGRGRGHLGVNLHRDRGLAVPQDLHGYAGMHVQGGQQRAAGLASPCTVISGTFAFAMQRLKLRGSIGCHGRW